MYACMFIHTVHKFKNTETYVNINTVHTYVNINTVHVYIPILIKLNGCKQLKVFMYVRSFIRTYVIPAL